MRSPPVVLFIVCRRLHSNALGRRLGWWKAKMYLVVADRPLGPPILISVRRRPHPPPGPLFSRDLKCRR